MDLYSHYLQICVWFGVLVFLGGVFTDLHPTTYSSIPCKQDNDCSNRTDGQVECLEHMCRCAGEANYDINEGRCVLAIDDDCDPYSDFEWCPENAFCHSEKKTCTCDVGFEPTNEDECKKPYGMKCIHWADCNSASFLRCLDGICSCDEPDKHIYDSSIKSCVAKANELCELQPWSNMQLMCVQHATCVKQNEHYGRCQCDEFHSPAPNGTCARRTMHQQHCQDTHDPCGGTFGLECHENYCRCGSGTIFDLELNSCRIAVNSQCDSHAEKCVMHAECRHDSNDHSHSLSGWRKCHCSSGYVRTPEGTCRAGLHTNCTTHTDCHNGIGLECSANKTCQCGQNQSYSVDRQLCVALPGFPCGLYIVTGSESPSTQEYIPCVSNAECIGAPATCQCTSHFQLVGGICAPKYEAICSPISDCVESLGLSCQAGSCKCANSSLIYEHSSRSCQVRAGHKCHLSLDFHLACVPGSFCNVNSATGGETGQCQCFSQFDITMQDSCLLSHESDCSGSLGSVTCNHEFGLDCINSTCTCPTGKIFSRDTGCIPQPNIVNEPENNTEIPGRAVNCDNSSAVCDPTSGYDNGQKKYTSSSYYRLILFTSVIILFNAIFTFS